MYRYCQHRLGEDHAEDATQDTFLAVLGSIARLPDDPQRHRYWIIDRARDACKAVLRARGRQTRLSQGLSSQPQVHEHDPADRVAAFDELERLVAKVGIRSRVDLDVIVLVMSGYQASEVGSLLGLSTSAVETRISRARQRLARRGVGLPEDIS